MMVLDFLSDNVSPAAPEVIAAVVEANSGNALSYGDDAWTAEFQAAMAKVFARECAAFPIASGASANAVSLGCITEPGTLIFCHEDAHIRVNEYGGPAFYTGATLVSIPGADGKITPGGLEAAFAAVGHVPPGSVLNLTNATEAGTVYTPEEVTALADMAHRVGLRVHMDGSRIANAIAHCGCHPADVTWRAGVDALSFGATKNGGMAADAIVFFDVEPALYAYGRRKRGGHVPSKMRFLAAQLLAYLADDGWLRRAAHANAMASVLAAGLQAIPGVAIVLPVEVNHVFIALPEAARTALADAGYRLLPYERYGEGVIRLVTHWATTEEEIERFVACVRDALLVHAAR